MRHKGFSLIEAAIVLGVVGLIIGGIWVVAASIRENMLANQISTGLLSTIAETQARIPISLTSGRSCSGASRILQDSYTISTAARMGLFPSDWIKGDRVNFPLGQPVGLSVCDDGTNGPIASVYVLNFPAGQKFSASLCMKVLPKILLANMNYRASVSGIAAYANSTSMRTMSWMSGMCNSNGPETVSSFYITFPLTSNQ